MNPTGSLTMQRLYPFAHFTPRVAEVQLRVDHTAFQRFRAPESIHDADEEVAVRRIEVNRTRDASHVQVHSFS